MFINLRLAMANDISGFGFLRCVKISLMRIFLRVIFYLSITPILIPIISSIKLATLFNAQGLPYGSYSFLLVIIQAIFAPQTAFLFLKNFPIIYRFPVIIIYIFGFVLFALSGLFILLEKRKSKKLNNLV